jgi:aminoglycoside 6'-N-acetyltransferase I
VSWTIRTARAADADDVERLLGDFAAEDGWPRHPIDPAERAALGRQRAGGMRVWLAVHDGGAAVGFAAAHEAHDLPEGPGAWLSDLYVAPAFRRKGAGRALVAAVAAWTRKRGGRWIMWHTDPGDADARRFYAKIGGAERPTHLLVTLKGRAFLRLA